LIKIQIQVDSTPYIEKSNRYKVTFEDLTGAFVTLPDVKPESIGATGFYGFIDLVFPNGTGVLEFPNNIYMVPGNPSDFVPIEVISTECNCECYLVKDCLCLK
jgi:hypothetical protein